MERYSLEKAQEEALKLEEKIVSGEAKDYKEAEIILDSKEYTPHKIEELSAGLEGDVPFPVLVPEEARVSFSAENILEKAGISPDKYRLVDNDVWLKKEARWREDDDPFALHGPRQHYSPPVASVVEKKEEGIWEIAKSAWEDVDYMLFKKLSRIVDGDKVYAKPALMEILGDELFEKIRDQIIKEYEDAKVEAEKENFKIRSKFWTEISEAEAFSCLPLNIQSNVLEYKYLHGDDFFNAKVKNIISVWPEAEALLEYKETGEILVNWGGHFREMGNTGNVQYWVIRPDGSFRPADQISYRKQYKTEGEKMWRIVGQEELAISWRKNNSAAAHDFRVDHFPQESITPEQKDSIAKIESMIKEKWEDPTGISRRQSPPVGDGWGIK